MSPRPLTTPDTPTPDAAVLGGPRIIDRYQIVAVIGRGATGSVYRAIDLRLGRTVALKTATGSRDGARLTDRVRQRFLREAMALSKVDQRNVVQVLDYGFADDGTPFLVMEHLRGRDLGAVLALAESPLPVDEVADIGLGVCAALRACHRVGIIHRDLKAANVFLVDTDTGMDVKVLDFGVSNAAAADNQTRAVQLNAPPHHLAPEQIDGKVGPASDQYALGVLLYFCVTGEFPQRLRGARPPPNARTCRRRWTPFSGGRLGWARPIVSNRSTRWGASCWNSRVSAARRNGGSTITRRRRRIRPGPARRRRRPRKPVSAPPGPARARRPSTPRARSPQPRFRAAPVATPGPAAWGRRSWHGWVAGWPLRAASIGCVALAAAGLASGRRRPPRPAPPMAARRSAPPEAAGPSRHTSRPKPEARPAVPAVCPVAEPFQEPARVMDPPTAPLVVPRRAKPHAPSLPPLPNINLAGIGIPSE